MQVRFIATLILREARRFTFHLFAGCICQPCALQRTIAPANPDFVYIDLMA